MFFTGVSRRDGDKLADEATLAEHFTLARFTDILEGELAANALVS